MAELRSQAALDACPAKSQPPMLRLLGLAKQIAPRTFDRRMKPVQLLLMAAPACVMLPGMRSVLIVIF